MATIIDEVQAARRSLFVGRGTELAVVDGWLGAERPRPLWLLGVSGMGGVGKTALLRQVLDLAAMRGCATADVDVRLAGRAHATLSALADEALARSGNRTDRSLVFALDNYEEIGPLDDWVREKLIGRLPADDVLVIVCGRQPLAGGWIEDPAWSARVRHLRLEPFTPAEAHEYLDRLGIPRDHARDDLLRRAGGLPLALSVGAEALRRGAALHPSGDVDVRPVISARLLRESADEDLNPLLDALAVLLEADQSLLQEVAGQPVPASAYRRLADLSFVRKSAGGLTLHAVARDCLHADLCDRAPPRARQLRRRALEALVRRAAEPGAAERRRAVQCLLFLCEDAALRSTLFSGWDAPTTGRAQPEDGSALHEMLAWYSTTMMGMRDTSDVSALLDTILHRIPESITVWRDAGGQPVAFVAVVPLHRNTIPLLEPHAAALPYLARCAPAERAALLRRAPAQADTYYWVMGAGRRDSALESTGYVFRETLAMLAAGARLIANNNNPELEALGVKLGFRERPGPRCRMGGAAVPFGVFELDTRGNAFPRWAARLIDVLDAPAPAAAAFPAAAGRAPGNDDLKLALRNLRRPRALAQAELAWLAPLLRSALTENPPPPPLTAEQQELLRRAYLQSRTPASELAERLHVSRATYFRRAQEAVQALGEALRSLPPGPR